VAVRREENRALSNEAICIEDYAKGAVPCSRENGKCA